MRTGDLLQFFNKYRPNVVHLSGHGSTRDELILHDNSNQAKPVSVAALRALSKKHGYHLRDEELADAKAMINSGGLH